MTDIDGIRHQRTVPFSKVRPEVWAKHLSDHSSGFAFPIKEVLDKIDSPFVTAISDCISPQASFYNNKLFLVGDALALFRPNVAQSTNQAALHCLLLEKLLQGEITSSAYEQQALSYAHTTLLWGREVGAQYLSSTIGHLYHKFRHRLAQKTLRLGVRL